MKKLMAIAGLFLFTSAAVLAQTPAPAPASDQLKEKFRTENPNAMGIVWKNDRDNSYRVTYTENKEEHAMIYDKDGNVISRQTVVKTESIPAPINEYYSKKTANANEYAPSYTVWQSTDKDGNVMYYSEYNGKKTWFDKTGKQVTMSGVAEGEVEKQDGKMPIDK